MTIIIYFIFLSLSFIFGGDIIYAFTGIGSLANWGTAIIPSVLIGIHHGTRTDIVLSNKKFCRLIAIFGSCLKLLISYIVIDSLLLLAIILIPLVTYCIILAFTKLGIKIGKHFTKNQIDDNQKVV